MKMIKAKTNYVFTQGVVLDANNFFKKDFTFKTDETGALEEGKFNDSFPTDVLDIWLENGVIEDINQFKPKVGDIVFYIVSLVYPGNVNAVGSFQFRGDSSHPTYVENGNCFRTKIDAENALRQMQQIGRDFYSQ